jgi:hypothetical protein
VLAGLIEAHAELGSAAFIEAFEEADSNNYRVVYEDELVSVLQEVSTLLSLVIL